MPITFQLAARPRRLQIIFWQCWTGSITPHLNLSTAPRYHSFFSIPGLPHSKGTARPSNALCDSSSDISTQCQGLSCQRPSPFLHPTTIRKVESNGGVYADNICPGFASRDYLLQSYVPPLPISCCLVLNGIIRSCVDVLSHDRPDSAVIMVGNDRIK